MWQDKAIYRLVLHNVGYPFRPPVRVLLVLVYLSVHIHVLYTPVILRGHSYPVSTSRVVEAPVKSYVALASLNLYSVWQVGYDVLGYSPLTEYLSYEYLPVTKPPGFVQGIVSILQRFNTIHILRVVVHEH